jgi:hypothetical protein
VQKAGFKEKVILFIVLYAGKRICVKSRDQGGKTLVPKKITYGYTVVIIGKGDQV